MVNDGNRISSSNIQSRFDISSRFWKARSVQFRYVIE